MAYVIVGMTVSLDGFVADSSGSAAPLYYDLEELQSTDYMRALIDETGSVLMGRRAFEMAEDPDWFVGNYEFQVPLFVLTHEPPKVLPKQDERLTFTFVSDGIEAAVEAASAAAGDKAVTVVGGASVVQQVLRAGLADELRMDVIPVILGAGLKFLEDFGPNSVQLEKISVEEVGSRTCLRFKVC